MRSVRIVRSLVDEDEEEGFFSSSLLCSLKDKISSLKRLEKEKEESWRDLDMIVLSKEERRKKWATGYM